MHSSKRERDRGSSTRVALVGAENRRRLRTMPEKAKPRGLGARLKAGWSKARSKNADKAAANPKAFHGRPKNLWILPPKRFGKQRCSDRELPTALLSGAAPEDLAEPPADAPPYLDSAEAEPLDGAALHHPAVIGVPCDIAKPVPMPSETAAESSQPPGGKHGEHNRMDTSPIAATEVDCEGEDAAPSPVLSPTEPTGTPTSTPTGTLTCTPTATPTPVASPPCTPPASVTATADPSVLMGPIDFGFGTMTLEAHSELVFPRLVVRYAKRSIDVRASPRTSTVSVS